MLVVWSIVHDPCDRVNVVHGFHVRDVRHDNVTMLVPHLWVACHVMCVD